LWQNSFSQSNAHGIFITNGQKMSTSANKNNHTPNVPGPEKIENADEDHGLEQLIENESKHKKFWMWFVIIIFAVILVWSSLTLIFGRYAIGDRRVAYISSSAKLKTLLNDQAHAYKLSLAYPDKSVKSFSLADMGLSLDLDASAQAIKQPKLADILMWWQPKKADLVFNADQIKFHDFLFKSASYTSQPAKDATLKIKNGKVVITNSVPGKRYGLLFPKDTLIDNANSLKPTTVDLQLLAYKPAITDKQLKSYEPQLKQILSQRVVLHISGTDQVVGSSDIGAWLDLSIDKNQKFKIDVNSGKVIEYINRVAQNYIHETQDQVNVKRDDGSIAVLVVGSNGTDVVKKSDIAVDISNKVLTAQGIEEDLPIKVAHYKTITAGDYPKWIEVNVTDKTMFAYRKTTLDRSFKVSAGAPATPTVLGQYKIQRKYVQQDMTGQNADGTDYFQAQVPWVSYFYGGYAIHGNYWRPLTWFGNINSSHGCVGVSVADGKWIYDWAPVGTPIVIHQ
jgi:lipoprotein-anchoring transpeptidase ErfK/SrfK